MKILFFGDIFGRSGRDALAKYLPELKNTLNPDLIIANGENASHGRGITPKTCKDLYDIGIACITSGNHIWDQREIISYISSDPRLLRPLNAPPSTPGKGVYRHTLPDGRSIVVACLMGRMFMEAMDDPFAAARTLTKEYTLNRTAHAIIVDFHAEATSEKMAFAHHIDGKVSAVIGTHTHIPTADAHILKGGTAYMTDAGMCGDYDSVVGIRKDIAIYKFTRKMPHADKMTPATGTGTVCGAFIITDDTSGLARSISPICLGGILQQSRP